VSALLAVLSSAMWGGSDFLGGLLSRRLPAYAVVAGSELSGLVFVGIVALVTGDWHASLGYLPYAVGAGLTGTIGLVAYYAGLASGTMGVVAPIASMGAIVPVGLGILGGDHPSHLQIAGIVIALVGVVAASGPELSGVGQGRPVALAVLAGTGFGFALYLIGIGSRHNVVMTLLGMRLTALLIFATAAIALRSTGGLTRRDLPPLMLVGFGDVTANLLFAIATRIGLISIASALTSFYPVVPVILARFVLQERLRRIQQVGVGLAIGGVALLSLG
jgi:drug/metabolite transporter (DMT)-like permease